MLLFASNLTEEPCIKNFSTVANYPVVDLGVKAALSCLFFPARSVFLGILVEYNQF